MILKMMMQGCDDDKNYPENFNDKWWLISLIIKMINDDNDKWW